MKAFLTIYTVLILISANGQILKDNVRDVDGNIYKTVKIGDQIWFADYLKVSKFSDGTVIPYVGDKNDWSEQTVPVHCNYYNKPDNIGKYGKLYNWYVVNDKRNVCPDGWHVPDQKEWEITENTLLEHSVLNEYKGWWSYMIYGASFLPIDYRTEKGDFKNDDSIVQAEYGGWWTSSKVDKKEAWKYFVGFSSYSLMPGKADKKSGLSILCIKDQKKK